VSQPDDPRDHGGEKFLAEIREQPQALLRLVGHESTYASVAATMIKRDAHLVRMVGHGSSDNAASYGVYAFGLIPRWTALRDSITLTVYYDSGPEMKSSTVIGLSQSGRTPDVVEYVSRARQSGAFTIALTNDPDSELARAAEAILPLAAGPEQAVAATKTYTNQVGALALLAAHVAGQGARYGDGLRETADLLAAHLPSLESQVVNSGAVALVHRSDVRYRQRTGVRNRTRDRTETTRDLSRSRRTTDVNGPRARAGSSSRLDVSGLGDRVERCHAPRGHRSGSADPGCRSLNRRQRRGCRSNRRCHVHPASTDTITPATRTDPLGGARPALRTSPRARQGPRP
jgi:SIS domain